MCVCASFNFCATPRAMCPQTPLPLLVYGVNAHAGASVSRAFSDFFPYLCKPPPTSTRVYIRLTHICVSLREIERGESVCACVCVCARKERQREATGDSLHHQKRSAQRPRAWPCHPEPGKRSPFACPRPLGRHGGHDPARLHLLARRLRLLARATCWVLTKNNLPFYLPPTAVTVHSPNTLPHT